MFCVEFSYEKIPEKFSHLRRLSALEVSKPQRHVTAMQIVIQSPFNSIAYVACAEWKENHKEKDPSLSNLHILGLSQILKRQILCYVHHARLPGIFPLAQTHRNLQDFRNLLLAIIFMQIHETKLWERQQESIFRMARMLNYGNPFWRSRGKEREELLADVPQILFYDYIIFNKFFLYLHALFVTSK